MDKYIQVLGWIAMGSLALAIARQLSEQRIFAMIPTNFGESYNRERWNKGLLENFTNPDGVQEPLTAQACYEKDFMAQSSKTGNFIQRTNNFRHDKPDNCSGALVRL
jgi:hypothetical protein